MTLNSVLRIADANLNRSREGLRVCEEVIRFALEKRAWTRELKASRHRIGKLLHQLPVSISTLLGSRRVQSDVGREKSKLEDSRQDVFELFLVNIERSKEALRVLEEVFKLIEPKLAGQFKKERFRVYGIEKKILPKLEALRDHGLKSDRESAALRRRAGGHSRRRGRHTASG